MPENQISLNLESLLKLSNSLNSSTDEIFILNSALLSLMGKLRMIRGAVFIPDTENLKFTALINKSKIINNEIAFFDINDLQNELIETDNPKYSKLIENGYKYIFPITYNESPLAFICLGQRMQLIELVEEEIKYAKLISQISAGALVNAKTFKSLSETKTHLEQHNQLLTSMFEMSREFSFFLSKDHIIRLMSYRLMGQLMVSRYCIYLLGGDNKLHLVVNRFDKSIPEAYLQEILTIDKTDKIKNIKFSDDVFKFFDMIKAKVFSPMIVQGKIKGFLIVGKKLNNEDFSSANIEFIEALGNGGIVAIENDRLFKEELEKKKMESEMNLGLEIQQNLMPKQIPQINGYTLAGKSIPSRAVGGDYFDFVKLSDSETLIIIADVSGKGLPAALLMANVQAAIRVLAPLKLSLKEIVKRINYLVFQNTSADKFITFFGGILNHSTNTFTYINAGHNPPILVNSNNEVNMLTNGGLILGFMEESPEYFIGEVSLSSGDLICMFTDGVTEAQDKHNNEFSEERLLAFVLQNHNLDSVEFLNLLIEEVLSFSGNSTLYDDVTSVILKRN